MKDTIKTKTVFLGILAVVLVGGVIYFASNSGNLLKGQIGLKIDNGAAPAPVAVKAPTVSRTATIPPLSNATPSQVNPPEYVAQGQPVAAEQPISQSPLQIPNIPPAVVQNQNPTFESPAQQPPPLTTISQSSQLPTIHPPLTSSAPSVEVTPAPILTSGSNPPTSMPSNTFDQPIHISQQDLDIAALKKEIASMNTEISGLRADITTLQNDVSPLKDRFSCVGRFVKASVDKGDGYPDSLFPFLLHFCNFESLYQ